MDCYFSCSNYESYLTDAVLEEDIESFLRYSLIMCMNQGTNKVTLKRGKILSKEVSKFTGCTYRRVNQIISKLKKKGFLLGDSKHGYMIGQAYETKTGKKNMEHKRINPIHKNQINEAMKWIANTFNVPGKHYKATNYDVKSIYEENGKLEIKVARLSQEVNVLKKLDKEKSEQIKSMSDRIARIEAMFPETKKIPLRLIRDDK